MQRLFNSYFNTFQNHPIFQFLRSDEFVVVLKVFPQIADEMDPRVLQYYKLDEDKRKDYTCVFSCGFIPQKELMNIQTLSRETYIEAIKQGRLDMLDWLIRTFQQQIKGLWLLDICAYFGKLDMMLWLHEHYSTYCKELYSVTIAAEEGHIEIIKWLIAHGFGRNIRCAVDNACRNGHVTVVDWFHNQPPPYFRECSRKAIIRACRCGHVEMIRWILDKQNYEKNWILQGINNACARGKLEVLKVLCSYCTQNNIEIICSTISMEMACVNGNIEGAAWMYENGYGKFNDFAFAMASHNGHLDVVQWLNTHTNIKHSPHALDFARRNGHQEIVNYLETHVFVDTADV